MSDEIYISIGDVVRKTGLTERALRFYEQKGLLAPMRQENGRRAYGNRELTRLHQITLMKRAGFSLAKISELLDSGRIDAEELIDAQIKTLESERMVIDNALSALKTARRTADGMEMNVEALCKLIQLGDREMQSKAWKKIVDQYYTDAEQEEWKVAKSKLSAQFDPQAYEESWSDLTGRIEDALPLDSASATAQAFVEEWNNLLEPFLAVATDSMKEGVHRIWNDMDSWSDEVRSPVSKEVFEFMTKAAQAHKK